MLLFTWLIPHTDDYGRMEGDPRIVKATVFPLINCDTDEVAKLLTELSTQTLIKQYAVGAEKYLEIVNFEEHQTFKNDRPRKGLYPSPVGIHRNPTGRFVRGSKVKGSKDNISKRKDDEFNKLNLNDERRKLSDSKKMI